MIIALLILILLAILFPGFIRGLIIFAFILFTAIPVISALFGDHTHDHDADPPPPPAHTQMKSY